MSGGEGGRDNVLLVSVLIYLHGLEIYLDPFLVNIYATLVLGFRVMVSAYLSEP